MIGYILLGLGVLIFGLAAAAYNGLVKSRNRVKEAFSTMDIYLKKRWDLIPNLVETVKGYAKHEKETLNEIISLRNIQYDQMSPDEKMDINQKLSHGLSKIIAISEAYPDLKASRNFSELSAALTRVEEDIANGRKYYNGCVRNLNDKIQVFPSNLIAGLFGFHEEKMFQIEDGERSNVKVAF